MGERTAHWAHYQDLPEGDAPHDRISNWWVATEAFGSDHLDVTIVNHHPGEHGPMHAHEPPVEEYYFVLEGTIDLITSDESIIGEEGTICYFPPGVDHRVENNSDEPALVLAFRCVPGDIPLSAHMTVADDE